jgi:Cys-rich protein (TIGR01571 family)
MSEGGKWDASIGDCCAPGCKVCFCSFTCGCQATKTYNYLTYGDKGGGFCPECGGPPPNSCFHDMFSLCFLCVLPLFLPIGPCCQGIAVRKAGREHFKFGEETNPCCNNDFLSAVFCPCCSVAQVTNQLMKNGVPHVAIGEAPPDGVEMKE